MSYRKPYEKHGAATAGRTPEYASWLAMRDQCSNSNHSEYKNYGGRGVTVCEAWDMSFSEFFRELGPKPSSRHTLDRIDGSRGYEPGNVRWATPKDQANNRRTNKISGYRGKSYTESQLLDRFWSGKEKDVARVRLHRRLRGGWSVEEAIETPPVGRGHKDVPCHLSL